MEWQENNEIDSQRHIEPFPVKYGIDNQEHIEPTHEKSLSDDTIILDKSDCLKNKNSADMDILQDKMPSTDGSEINRSSNRTKKFPASRYSNFLWEI